MFFAVLSLALAGGLGDVQTGVCRPSFTNRRLPHDPAHLTPPDTAFSWRLEETSRDSAITTYRLTFPSPVVSAYPCNNTVWCEYMAPQGPARHPAAVVLHFLNDPGFATTRMVCLHLARNGVASLLLKMAYYGERRPPIKLEERLRDPYMWIAAWQQSVQDVRCALAWLRTRSEVDPARTGLVGISLGAMIGSLVTGVDARVKRSVLILGGGNLHDILWSAAETKKTRTALEERGMSAPDAARVFAPIEPLRFAAPLPAGTVLMFNGRADTTVPPACAEALAKAFQEPETVWFHTSHVGIIAHLGEVLERTLAFLKRPST